MPDNAMLDLTSNDWILMESKAKRMDFKLGQEIIQEGSRIDYLYVIREGEASVELKGTTSRAGIAMLRRGDVCGEMAFLGNTASAAVIAKDEVRVDAIRADDLRQLIKIFPGFGTRFYRSLAVILAQRLRQTSKELLKEMTNKQ